MPDRGQEAAGDRYLDAVLDRLAGMAEVPRERIDPGAPLRHWLPDEDCEADLWELAAGDLGVDLEAMGVPKPPPDLVAGLPRLTMGSLAILGAVSASARRVLAANTFPEYCETPASMAEGLRLGRYLDSGVRGGPVHWPWTGFGLRWGLGVLSVLLLGILPGMLGAYPVPLIDRCACPGDLGPLPRWPWALGLGLWMATIAALTLPGLWAIWRAR